MKSKWLRTDKFSFYLLLLAISVLLFGFFLRLVRESQTVGSFPVTSWMQDNTSDCGVVLTGGPGRVREGIDLLYAKKIKKLIISGANPEVRVHELLPKRLWVYYPGVDHGDIILEKHSKTTWGNAQQTLPIVEALRCRDLVLITSHLHMWRSFRTFRSVFPDQYEIKTQAVVGASYKPGLIDLYNEAIKSLFYSIWAY